MAEIDEWRALAKELEWSFFDLASFVRGLRAGTGCTPSEAIEWIRKNKDEAKSMMAEVKEQEKTAHGS